MCDVDVLQSRSLVVQCPARSNKYFLYDSYKDAFCSIAVSSYLSACLAIPRFRVGN